MHKYLVEITETLQRQFDVEAQSKEEAEKIANMMYRNGDVILNAEAQFLQCPNLMTLGGAGSFF